MLHDHSYTKAMRQLVEGVNSQVATALKQGKSLDQTQATVDATSFRSTSAVWMAAALDDGWNATVHALVERAWHALRGLD